LLDEQNQIEMDMFIELLLRLMLSDATLQQLDEVFIAAVRSCVKVACLLMLDQTSTRASSSGLSSAST